MQVWDGLSGIGPVVEYEPIARLFQPKFVRHFRGFEHEMTKHFVVFTGGFGDARNGLFGNDQYVCGGLRLNVAKGEHEVVFVNNLGRDFARADFLKKRSAHSVLESMVNRPSTYTRHQSFRNSSTRGDTRESARATSRNADSIGARR